VRTFTLALIATTACGGAASRETARVTVPPPAATPPHTPKPAPPPLAQNGVSDAVAVLASFWMLMPAADDPHAPPLTRVRRHDASGTCLPLDHGTFAERGVRDYGPNDMSVSLLDASARTLVTLYTYPATKSVGDEFQGVLGAMCRGAPAISTHLRDDRFPDEGIIGACASPNGLEQALLFRRDAWFYEARFTYGMPPSGDRYSASMSVERAAFRPCPPP
jgi:hypothetical protein